MFSIRSCFRAALLLCFALAIAGYTAWAQDTPNQPLPVPASFNKPIPLIPKALSAFKRRISSTDAQAQAYFNQGFQLAYAFDMEDAARSFREAEKHDPNCAICYWGEAWAWGPDQNGGMLPFEPPLALAAIRKAIQLAPGHTSSIEQALIHAMSVRYVEHYDEKKRRDQDAAYAEALLKVQQQFPNDLDVATLYGDALFLLAPRPGIRDINNPSTQKILGVLEGVLKVDSRHIGACHLLIHLTESTSAPEIADACAAFIGNSMPGMSHINHMPSHTWNREGRWGDSVRANLQAWHSDQMAAFGEAFSLYPPHNLQMLSFVASMDGQGAIALQAAKDYAKITGSDMFQILTMVRFGRFDEIKQFTKRPEDPIEAGVWDFGQGYSHLRGTGKALASYDLKGLLDAASMSSAVFRVNSAQNILGTLGGILEGEIYRANGEMDKAIASFTRAVTLQDAMIYDEPEPLPFAARHWLGAALLEAKRYPEAELVYREDLKRHPHNGWSLFGLKAALEAQNKPLQDVDKDFDASWARSDTWIRASRF